MAVYGGVPPCQRRFTYALSPESSITFAIFGIEFEFDSCEDIFIGDRVRVGFTFRPVSNMLFTVFVPESEIITFASSREFGEMGVQTNVFEVVETPVYNWFATMEEVMLLYIKKLYV